MKKELSGMVFWVSLLNEKGNYFKSLAAFLTFRSNAKWVRGDLLVSRLTYCHQVLSFAIADYDSELI